MDYLGKLGGAFRRLVKGPNIEEILEKLKGKEVTNIELKGYAKNVRFDTQTVFYVGYECQTAQGKNLRFRERVARHETPDWIQDLKGYVSKKKEILEAKINSVKCEIKYIGRFEPSSNFYNPEEL